MTTRVGLATAGRLYSAGTIDAIVRSYRELRSAGFYVDGVYIYPGFADVLMWVVFQNTLPGYLVIPRYGSVSIYDEGGWLIHDVVVVGGRVSDERFHVHLPRSKILAVLQRLLDGLYTLSVFLASVVPDDGVFKHLADAVGRLAESGAVIDQGLLSLFEDLAKHLRVRVYRLAEPAEVYTASEYRRILVQQQNRGRVAGVEVEDHGRTLLVHPSGSPIIIQLSAKDDKLVVNFRHVYFARWYSTADLRIEDIDRYLVDPETVKHVATGWREIVEEALNVLEKHGDRELANAWRRILGNVVGTVAEVPAGGGQVG